uniref:Ig-like domain-containing protein n=1 Tax=Ficedula albicollis TaxID=59894 RepID=A0A803W9A2_FICAL
LCKEPCCSALYPTEPEAEQHSLHFAEGSASLEIKHLDASDAGVYVCRATNSAGSKESSSTLFIKGLAICFTFLGIFPLLLLTIFSFQRNPEPPSFTETPCVLGSSALLECKVSGSPPISVAWFQNGLKLVSGEKHQISFSDNLCILEVNSLSHSDTGTYTCKATNTAGSDECSANLPTLLHTWNLLRCQLGLTQHCSATLLEHLKLLCLGTKVIQNSGLLPSIKCSLKTMLLHLFSTKWLAPTVENISARQKTV